MPHPSSSHDLVPRPETDLLIERLQSVRGALGASKLGLARRFALGEPSPFELLAVVDPEGAAAEPEGALPLAAYGWLLREGRRLDVTSSHGCRLGAWLRERDAARLVGWPLPGDRLPCVLAVALYRETREPGPHRWAVAQAGLDALARDVAPPHWLPRGRGRGEPIVPLPTAEPTPRAPASVPGEASCPAAGAPDPEGTAGPAEGSLPAAVAEVERKLIRRALQGSEGNKAAAARALRLSRQGLYRKLRRHGLV